ncbi:hypothetical protein IG631_16638 [Alternaria alternata]|nr:hypothetical protein IG631_16638 [Alternaria alternata]
MWRQKIDLSDRRIMSMFGRVWASAFMRHGLEHMQSLVGFVCLALASGFCNIISKGAKTSCAYIEDKDYPESIFGNRKHLHSDLLPPCSLAAHNTSYESQKEARILLTTKTSTGEDAVNVLGKWSLSRCTQSSQDHSKDGCSEFGARPLIATNPHVATLDPDKERRSCRLGTKMPRCSSAYAWSHSPQHDGMLVRPR